MSVALRADTVSAFGFAFDSLVTDLSYIKPNGTVAVRVRQGNAAGLRAERRLHARQGAQRAAARRRGASLRHHDVAHVAFRGRPLGRTRRSRCVNLELTSGANQRIYANGLLPTDGPANFDLAVTNFAVENIAELLQSDLPVTGRVSFDAHVQGTADEPTTAGHARLRERDRTTGTPSRTCTAPSPTRTSD